MNVLINGFGRIGRAVFRNLWERGLPQEACCTAINDAMLEIDNLIYLLKYDSIYGRFNGVVTKSGPNEITVSREGKEWLVKVYKEPNIAPLQNACSGVNVFVDATGNEQCANFSWSLLKWGVSYVIVTNTFYNADLTLILGHNDQSFNLGEHRVISSGICDGNATIPLLGKIRDAFGIDYCFVTTLHPWLSYQNIMDGFVRMQKKPGETVDYYPLGRSSVLNLIPKTTTLGPVLKNFFPEIKDKLSYMSFRTPTQIVSCADISIVLSQSATQEQLLAALNSLDKNIVSLDYENFVSCDCTKTDFSAIVDMRFTKIDNERHLKLVAWYDNEWGYSSRVVDIIGKIEKGV